MKKFQRFDYQLRKLNHIHIQVTYIGNIHTEAILSPNLLMKSKVK